MNETGENTPIKAHLNALPGGSLLRTSVILVLCACVLTCGCSKRVPLEAVAESGADIGVRLTTVAGEELEGALMSFDSERLVVEVPYLIGRGAELRGTGDDQRVVVEGEEVPGRVVRVVLKDNNRTADVERTFLLREVAQATFHRTTAETRSAPLVSTFLGPLVGLILAALI